MQTQVTFRSDRFPAYEGEEERINPGLWGQRLAEYLSARLSERGIATEEPVDEDWGWYVPIRNQEFPLGVCCGHQFGDPDEFICFIDPKPGMRRRWFTRIDTTEEVSRVKRALEEILSADPEIRDVAWSTDSR